MRLLVVDNSEYVEFARTLARSGYFDNVGYYCDWTNDTPEAREAAVGAGFPEITREYDLFTALADYDAFAFPHLYWSDMQEWLVAQGKKVWGSRQNERLELDRWHLIKEMRKAGLKTSPSQQVTLEKAKAIIVPGDVLKVSTFRGDVETFIHDGSFEWYHDLALRWGPMVDSLPVIVQKPIPNPGVEGGFDMLVVGGKPIYPISVGYEEKDAGYIEKNVRTLPRVYKGIMDGTLKMIDGTYNNFLSTEVLNDHMLDITTRMPQPPGELKLYIWEGLPKIIYETLNGNGQDPRLDTKPCHEWGAELQLRNTEPRRYKRFGAIPPELQPHVYFSRAFQFNGEIWTVPWRNESNDIIGSGAVVAGGDSAEEAIDNCIEIYKELKMPSGIIDPVSVKYELLETLEQGYKEGVVL